MDILGMRAEYAAQVSIVYTRTDTAAAGGAGGYGVLQSAPPHRRFSRAVHANTGGFERLRRNKERCADFGVFGNGGHGGIGIEPHLARRQGFGAYRREVWGALARSGQLLRMHCRSAERTIWRNLFA